MRDAEKHRESRRKWCAANPEKCRESRRKWRAANPEKYREGQSKWRAANHEKMKECKRKWAAENPEQLRKWRAANPEKVRTSNRRTVAQLSRGYVVAALVARTPIQRHMIPDTMIEAKRALIQIRRIEREQNSKNVG